MDPTPSEGYMWKRAPRADDVDKNNIKRMLFQSAAYKRRYFVLNPAFGRIYYFHDASKATCAGDIDLTTLLGISTELLEPEGAPSDFPLNLVAPARTWILFAETLMERDVWVARIQQCMDYIKSHQEEFTTKDSIVSTGSRKSETRFPYRGKRKSTLGSLIFQRHSNAQRGSTSDITSDPTISRQTQRFSKIKTQSRNSLITGNVSCSALSIYSNNELDHLSFFPLLASWCDGPDVIRELFESAIIEFGHEGSILVEEGNYLDAVYFIISGDVSRRKSWFKSNSAIASSLAPGAFFGDVEMLLFNGKSVYTIITGANTVYAKIPKSAFMELYIENGVFFDTLTNQFLNRTQDFMIDVLGCHPLFADTPSEDIGRMTKVFRPKFYPSGSTLLLEGSTSNEFFIFLEGSCNIFKRNAYGVDQIVNISCNGDCIGELGLMKNQARDTSVVAFTDLIVLETDARGFLQFMEVGGLTIQSAIGKSVSDQMTRALQKIPLFSDLDSDFETISNCLIFKEYPPDYVLIKHNERIDGFYLVIHGNILMTIDCSSTHNFTTAPIVDVLSTYDFCGESAMLLSNANADASFITKTSCVVLFAEITDFKELLMQCPVLRVRLEEKFHHRQLRLEIIDTLTKNISTQMDAELIKYKQEVQYLRAEVTRLGGNLFTSSSNSDVNDSPKHQDTLKPMRRMSDAALRPKASATMTAASNGSQKTKDRPPAVDTTTTSNASKGNASFLNRMMKRVSGVQSSAAVEDAELSDDGFATSPSRQTAIFSYDEVSSFGSEVEALERTTLSNPLRESGCASGMELRSSAIESRSSTGSVTATLGAPSAAAKNKTQEALMKGKIVKKTAKRNSLTRNPDADGSILPPPPAVPVPTPPTLPHTKSEKSLPPPPSMPAPTPTSTPRQTPVTVDSSDSLSSIPSPLTSPSARPVSKSSSSSTLGDSAPPLPPRRSNPLPVAQQPPPAPSASKPAPPPPPVKRPSSSTPDSPAKIPGSIPAAPPPPKPPAPPAPHPPPRTSVAVPEEVVPPGSEEKVEKYRKMQKMNFPEGAIRQRMMIDGMDHETIDAFFAGAPIVAPEPPPATVEVDETMVKYAKMKKLGLPDGAIRQKMTTDGFEPGDIDKFLQTLQ